MPGESEKLNRRDALRGIFLFSAGITLLAITGPSIAFGSSKARKDPTFIQTKVVYFGMSIQMTGIKEEYFTIQTPARLQGLLSQIEARHEVFAAMLPTMQILVDGNPFTFQDNPLLQDKTEVDFIPVYAGG